MKIIIKPFSEIILKSKAVRKNFMFILKRNISLSFHKINKDVQVRLFWDKIEIIYSSEEDISIFRQVLSKIPWIEYFLDVHNFYIDDYIFSSNSISFNDNNKQKVFDFILEKVSDFYFNLIDNKSFAIRFKRNWNHNFTSIELERYIWSKILEITNNSRVNLKNPDVLISLELRDKELFIVKEKVYWIWWYPISSQDKLISLISGWFDSSVSSFLMMKRWVKLDYLFFDIWWQEHELWVKNIVYHLWDNFSVWYNAKFIIIDFQEINRELIKKVKAKYRSIILKRLFLKCSDILAKEKWYYAIVKGDSLWQVSSQTLANMNIIDKASDSLVLRPLISYNKQEIIDISKKIFTYDLACNIPEYCWLSSDKASAKANLQDILDEEKNIDIELILIAFRNRKVLELEWLLNNIDNQVEIEYVKEVWEFDIIIDIRDRKQITKDKLGIVSNQIINIPFFEINNKFSSLDQDRNYLFYCEKSILSKTHALYLRSNWFSNIKILKID